MHHPGQTTAEVSAGSRLSRWAPKHGSHNSPSTWKVSPPSQPDRQTDARAAGQWIPQFVGGLPDLDGCLADDAAPFVYLTTRGEPPELYDAPFAEMQKYSIVTDAPACELSALAQAPGVRAVEYKRLPSPAGTWRVRVYVENATTTEFDEWCLSSKSALWARRMKQDAQLVRVPDDKLEALIEYAKTGNAEQARALIAEITATGGRPDQFAWSALLSACAKSDLVCMNSVMHEMQENGVVPNAHGLNAVSGAYSKAGQPESIRRMMREMDDAGVGMNVYIFTSLVAAYGKSGQPLSASNVLDSMRAGGVPPNVATYNALISAWCKASSEQTVPMHTALRQAADAFQQMQQVGLRPDTYTYTALMDAYLQAGDPHTALAMVQKMEADGLQADETSTIIAGNIHRTLQQQADGPPRLAQNVSEHTRCKGSRAATGTERSQIVPRWRPTPGAASSSRCDTGRTVCRQYFATGSCMRGDACKFLHKAPDGAVGEATDADSSAGSSRRDRSRYAPPPGSIARKGSSPEGCGNWRTTGRCQYGDKCRYSHDEPKLARVRTPATVARTESVQRTTTQKPRQADHRRVCEARAANPWTASCQESQPTNQTKPIKPAKVAEVRVECATCGNSFAAADETSFRQHQEKCANKANKGNKGKLVKRSNNWTKVKATRAKTRRCATVRV